MNEPTFNNPVLLRMKDCLDAGRRVLRKGARGTNRQKAVMYLREGIDLAKRFQLDDAWVVGAVDLAGLLLQPTRVPAQEALESINLLEQATEIARRSSRPDLGLILTNLAEARMRVSTDFESLNQARRELEEALPLRAIAVDRAYTLHNLARTYFRAQVETPRERLDQWNIARLYYQSALELFRGAAGEASQFARTAVNLAEVVCRTAPLTQKLAVIQDLSGAGASIDVVSDTNLTEIDATYGIWHLAGINAPLLEGIGNLDELLNVRIQPIDGATESMIVASLETLDEARIEVAGGRDRLLWATMQYWRASLMEHMNGSVSLDSARERELGIETCPMDEDPENWCIWATDAMHSFAGLGDHESAVRIGLKAIQAYDLAMQTVPGPFAKSDLAERFHYLGRRVAFLLLEAGRVQEAVRLIQETRGLSRLRRSLGPPAVDAIGLSKIFGTALLYLVAGPESTHFVVVSSELPAGMVSRRYEIVTGKQLIGFLMNFSPSGGGLVAAQGVNQLRLQESLNQICSGLSPLMTAVHEWLSDLHVADVAILPTGPYALLPLTSVPVHTAEGLVPFGWLHRSTTLPSAFRTTAEIISRPISRSIVLAANPARPDLAKLRTRSECESISNTCGSHGWSTTLLLNADASKENVVRGSTQSGILHYAGHARTDLFDPRATVLCLSDGDVSLIELADEFSIRPQMLVLSACQTGQICSLRAPDENLGLASIAIDGGVRVVVGSLWPVEDSATVKFMKLFYKTLVARLAQHDAFSALIVSDVLMETQRGVSNSQQFGLGSAAVPDYSLSRHWAAFQAFGF